jgi:hypothetical protein
VRRLVRLLGAPFMVATFAAAPFGTVGLPVHRATAIGETDPCAGAQLDVGGSGSSAAAGTGIATVRITNVTSAACALIGRPQLEFLNPGGKRIVSQIGDLGPGVAFEAPKQVVLQPGTSAGFIVTTNDGLQPGADCTAIGSIRLHLVAQNATFAVSPPQFAGWQLCGGESHPSNVSSIVNDATVNDYAPVSLPCTASGLVLSLSAAGQASGAALVIAHLADRYGELCTLDGYPRLSLTTATGHTVLSFTPGDSFGTFAPPPLPRPVSLGASRVAQFVFTAGDYQTVRNKPCPSSTTLRLVLPDGSQIVQSHTFSLCEGGGVGPFTEPGILTRPLLSDGSWRREGAAG